MLQTRWPPVVATHRRPLLGAVAGEVGERERARIHLITLHGGDDLRRDRSFVNCVCSIPCDGAHGFGVGRVDQRLAGAPRTAVRVKKVGASVRKAREIGVPLDHVRKPRRDGEAALGEHRSRLEEARPGRAAMSAMDSFEHPDDARYPDRQTADGCLRPRTGCAVRS